MSKGSKGLIKLKFESSQTLCCIITYVCVQHKSITVPAQTRTHLKCAAVGQYYRYRDHLHVHTHRVESIAIDHMCMHTCIQRVMHRHAYMFVHNLPPQY